MCCLIAMSILYRNYRIQEALKAKQQNLKHPVLFYVDLMMREDRPVEVILDRGMELFSLEDVSEAEDALVAVMKGEKHRSVYDGKDADKRRYEAAHCLKRIVWLLVTVKRYGFRERYRHIRLSTSSTDAIPFAGFKWYPEGLVPVEEMQKIAGEMGNFVAAKPEEVI